MKEKCGGIKHLFRFKKKNIHEIGLEGISLLNKQVSGGCVQFKISHKSCKSAGVTGNIHYTEGVVQES